MRAATLADKLAQIEEGSSPIISGLYCKPALSLKGLPCLRVLSADVCSIGLPTLQHADVAEELRDLGVKGCLYPDSSGAVNVPLTMARRLHEVGVALVAEALQAASPEAYQRFLRKGKQAKQGTKRARE